MSIEVSDTAAEDEADIPFAFAGAAYKFILNGVVYVYRVWRL